MGDSAFSDFSIAVYSPLSLFTFITSSIFALFFSKNFVSAFVGLPSLSKATCQGGPYIITFLPSITSGTSFKRKASLRGVENFITSFASVNSFNFIPINSDKLFIKDVGSSSVPISRSIFFIIHLFRYYFITVCWTVATLRG